MSEKKQLEKVFEPEYVEFLQDLIPCVEVNGKAYVVVKAICDVIGLNSPNAIESMKNDDVLGKKIKVLRLNLGVMGSSQRVVLPIERVEGWLFSIDSKKVKEEVRPRLVSYKDKCYEVLHSFFWGNGRKMRELCVKEKQLIDEKHQLEFALKFLKSRYSYNSRLLEEIRDHRFQTYRLFEPSETDDARLKAIFEMVGEMKNQDQLLN